MASGPQARREGLFDFVLEGQQEAKVQRLRVMRESARYPVPAELRVVSRTPGQWRSLVRATRAEERAVRLGEAMDLEQAEVLAAARADPVVVQAALNLDANLDAIATLFEQYGG